MTRMVDAHTIEAGTIVRIHPDASAIGENDDTECYKWCEELRFSEDRLHAGQVCGVVGFYKSKDPLDLTFHKIYLRVVGMSPDGRPCMHLLESVKLVTISPLEQIAAAHTIPWPDELPENMICAVEHCTKMRNVLERSPGEDHLPDHSLVCPKCLDDLTGETSPTPGWIVDEMEDIIIDELDQRADGGKILHSSVEYDQGSEQCVGILVLPGGYVRMEIITLGAFARHILVPDDTGVDPITVEFDGVDQVGRIAKAFSVAAREAVE